MGNIGLYIQNRIGNRQPPGFNGLYRQDSIA